MFISVIFSTYCHSVCCGVIRTRLPEKSYFKNHHCTCFYRPRTEYDGRLCFHRCLSANKGLPEEGNVLTHVCLSACPRGGGGVPQGTYPPPVRFDGEGYQGTYPTQPGLTGGGGTPSTHPLARFDGGGYPKVPPPLPGQGTYPPPPG